MILRNRCSRSYFLPLSLSFFLPLIRLSLSLLAFSRLCLFPPFFSESRLSFSLFFSVSQRFFSFSPHDRVSSSVSSSRSPLALRGRYWSLRLRLSRGQRDRIVFRTIWLIECRRLGNRVPGSLPLASSTLCSRGSQPRAYNGTYSGKLPHERVFKPRSRNWHLAKSGGSRVFSRRRLWRRNGELRNWIGQRIFTVIFAKWRTLTA